MIRRLLVANRGEIACRIFRTCRLLGIETVAVYSRADRDAAHVRMADMAVLVGEAAPECSYLSIDSLLVAARASEADAVHPGYGFLSENAAFADACRKAKLIFVGPPATAIRVMGDKAEARRLMIEAGLPVLPGYDGEDQTAERMRLEAERIGYPLMIKAAAGGGGRGMRRVNDPEEIEAALASASREAMAAFGDGRLLLERLVEDGRHIEVQIFADRLGRTVHLGERDCSAQRRHQKVIEETPAPGLSDTRRAALWRDALKAAMAIGYEGAGTVEFILDRTGAYFFLEMNTRLQVEHPVSEMVCGVDLVEWQILVAAGYPLPRNQAEIRFSGHAIEARLYAEDPTASFAPQTGRIVHFQPSVAAEGGTRIDSAVAEGDSVSHHYDPLIAKLVAHGRDRDEAILRLRMLMRDHPLLGLVTNRRLLVGLIESEEFANGEITTGLLDAWRNAGHPLFQALRPSAVDFALAGAILARSSEGDWFRSSGPVATVLRLVSGEATARVRLAFENGVPSCLLVDGEAVDLQLVACKEPEVRYRLDGVDRRATVAFDGRVLWLDRDGVTLQFAEKDPLALRTEEPGGAELKAPMAGLVRMVHVTPGAIVTKGDALVLLEAMKTETMLTAPVSGVIHAVHVRVGAQVAAGTVLVVIGPDDG
jgi:geranyl-CoA carboxylase alpha subunit